MEKKLLLKILITLTILAVVYSCREKKVEKLSDKYFITDTHFIGFNGFSANIFFEVDFGQNSRKYYYLYKYNLKDECWDIQYYDSKDQCNYMMKVKSYKKKLEKGEKIWFKSFYLKWPNNPRIYKSFSNSPYVNTNLDTKSFYELYPEYRGNVHKDSVSIIEINDDFYSVLFYTANDSSFINIG